MKFNCEKLEVYQISQALILEVYKLIDKFPASKRFGLVSQIKRAVVSIILNIAEGSGKWSKKDFSNFIRISIGSLIETDTILKLSIKLGYIDEKDYANLDKMIESLYFKLIGLNKSISK